MAVLAMLIDRIRAASSRERRVLGLAYGAAAGAVALVAAAFLVVAGGGMNGSWLNGVVFVAASLGLVAVPVALLLGLVRERLAYASVSDLVHDLDGQGPEELEEALGRALGDPQGGRRVSDRRESTHRCAWPGR